MSGSTTNLDLISSSQASKEVTANALFDAGSPAALYGRRASKTANLTWGYYGGYLSITGTPTAIANGTVVLTNAATNYITAARATGNVAAATSNASWNDTANHARLYSVVTAGNLVTSYVDVRSFALGENGTTVYAPMAGNASQVFSVAPATAAAHAARWDTPDMASITVTQGTGALTFAGIAHPLTFRSATLTDGAVSTIIADPADLVLPSGGTLGFVTTVLGRIVIAEMNNGGTSEYAICNIAGGLRTDETNLISTTAIADTSEAANIWYSTTARTNLPYKIVGAVDVVNTAGAWGDPVLVQAGGGNALTAMSSSGYGQTWQSVTRTKGTTYYNTTGSPINLYVRAYSATIGDLFIIVVGGFGISSPVISATNRDVVLEIVIPPGKSYIWEDITGTFTANQIVELR